MEITQPMGNPTWKIFLDLPGGSFHFFFSVCCDGDLTVVQGIWGAVPSHDGALSKSFRGPTPIIPTPHLCSAVFPSSRSPFEVVESPGSVNLSQHRLSISPHSMREPSEFHAWSHLVSKSPVWREDLSWSGSVETSRDFHTEYPKSVALYISHRNSHSPSLKLSMRRMFSEAFRSR